MFTVDDFLIPLSSPTQKWTRLCPYCQTNLKHNRFIAIATGCCRQCGRQVLEFPVQKGEPSLTLEEIMRMAYDEIRIKKQLAYILLASLLWPLAWVIMVITFGKNLALIPDELIAYGPIPLATVWCLYKEGRRCKRSYLCIYCQSIITKRHKTLLSLTGRCPSCAQLIVKDLALPAEKVGTPRLEIETYLKELKATRKRLQSPANWASGWLVFMIILGLILVEYFIAPFRARLVNLFGADNAVFVILGLVFLWVLIMFGPFTREVIRLSKNLTKDNLDEPGINCPCCSKTVFNSDISIATKRCHHCREVVFAEPEKREMV